MKRSPTRQAWSNDDPTGAAWFFKIKVDDLSAVDAYMTEDEYKELIGE